MNMENKAILKETLLYNEVFTERDRLRAPWELSKVLKEKSIFNFSKSFPKIARTYIYDPNRGIYEEYTDNELTLILARIFEISKLPVPMYQIKGMVESLKFHLNADLGTPQYDTQHLVFDNGLFNVKTKQLVEWNPQIFATSRMEGEWPSDYVEPVEFFKFLRTLCGGNVDRMNFLRSYAWASFAGYTQSQTLLYIHGPGASGKSTFGQILEAVIGPEYCVSTTFKELSRSSFETSFLRGKKLITFNDTDDCKEDLSLLKQLVGGDTIKGRVKHTMQNLDFVVEALIILTSNHPILTSDTGDSLTRRVRLFPAHNVIPPSERKNLLYRTKDGYGGVLAPELGYIRKWVYNTESELPQAKDYLRLTTTMVPSLVDTTKEAKMNMNPLISWIQDEIEEGDGSYVGFKMKFDSKSTMEIARRKLLYPTYRTWAQKRDMYPLGHKRFANELIWTLKDLGFKRVEKIRRTEGMFITGVGIKANVYNHDNLYGAPLQIEDSTTQKVSKRPRGGANGRYTKKADGANNKENWIMHLYKLLRNLFDNHFIVSFIRFTFDFIINKLVKTGLEKDPTSWYTRIHSFLTFVGRFLNWSIAFTIVVTAFRYLYDSIMGLISHLPFGKLGRGAGGVDRLGFFKGLWPTNSQPSLWDKITSFQPTATPSPSLTWGSISFLPKVLLVVVGSYFLYIFIRVMGRMVLRLLHNIFDWVTPANIQTLQGMVDRHSTKTLQEIRNLGNYVILIDKALEEVRKEAGLAREVQEGLQGISKDVIEIRELDKKFEGFVFNVSSRPEKLGEQNDDVSHTLAYTMKAILNEYEKSHNAMEKGLIDDESFTRSYRIVREGKGYAIPLHSVRKMLDPNAEVTAEVGRITRILQSGNEALKEAEREKAASKPRRSDDDRQGTRIHLKDSQGIKDDADSSSSSGGANFPH